MVVIEMSVPGVRRHYRGGIEACPGGVEQNRSLSRKHLQVCPLKGKGGGGGVWRYNKSLSRGAFIYLHGGGGGGVRS